MEGFTVADALALQNRRTDDGMFGGNGAWMMMFLFFLLAWGGNGFGYGGRGAYANEISNEFLYTNLNNTVDRGFMQVANQNFGIQKDLCQGFGNIERGICNLQHNQDMCCCTTNRNIDALRYENAKNTCDIVNAIRTDGEATRALINVNTMQELRDRLNTANNALTVQTIVNGVVSQVSPTPVPAWITCSPYTTPFGNFGNCGSFNNGCGCGC